VSDIFNINFSSSHGKRLGRKGQSSRAKVSPRNGGQPLQLRQIN
jgi:hypothetical protein